MPGPGGQEVGRVSIRAVPDTDRFRKELQEQLKKAVRGLRVEIPVSLDTDGVKAEIKKVEEEAKKAGASIKMDVEVDGDGARREAGRVRALVQKLVGAIKLNASLNLPESIAVIKAQMAIIQKAVKGYNIKIPMEVVGLTKWLGILTAVSGILLTIPNLLAAIGGAVNVVGGALALLPALAAGAAAGIAALVVGTQGFFTAVGASGDVEAFEEELSKLTPSARSAARALAEFREPLREIRESVQEELFTGMAKQFSKMKALLPPIKTGLTGVAGGIRDMISEWIVMATTNRSVKDTGIILSNVQKGFEAMRPALANFGQAFKDIAVVGSTFLPQLGKSVANMSQRFADWAANARKTGEMREWIAVAIAKLKQLGRVVRNIVKGFQNITKGLREGAGEDFLDMFERLTDNFKDFTGTKEVQSSLRSLGRVMREVVDIGTTVFKELFTSIGKVFKDLEPFLLTFARALGGTIVGALKAITPLLQSMAKWLSENKQIMAPLAVVLVALVTGFKLLVTVAKGVEKVADSFKVLKAASGTIGEVAGKVGEAVGKIVTGTKKIIVAMATTAKKVAVSAAQWIWSWTQIAAQAATQAAKAAGAWIAQTARMVAATVANLAVMAARWTANFIRMAATAAAQGLKIALAWTLNMVRMVATTLANLAIIVAAWVANWVRMAAVATANAIRMAAAWIIAMGPVAWVIAAIVALVAIIVLNWDSIVSFLTGVWNWISDLAQKIWGNIASFFSSLWDTITGAVKSAWNAIAGFFSGLWSKITSGLTSAARAVWDWAKSVPGKIWDGIKAAGRAIVDAGKWIIKGLVNGLKRAAGAIWDFISGICADIWDGIKNFFGIGSPSKEMMKIGRWINEGWIIGLRQNAGKVADQATNVADGVRNAFSGLENIGSAWADSVTASAPAALTAVDKIVDKMDATANHSWKALITSDEFQPLEDRVLNALASGLKVELDGKEVAKSVKKTNTLNSRR